MLKDFNSKTVGIFGAGFVVFYVYFVMTNQEKIIDAFMAPLR